MKVIDLLNKIANGEKVPKKIKAQNYIWKYEERFSEYKNDKFQELLKFLSGYYNNGECSLTLFAALDYEVEILEDTTEEIEEITVTKDKNGGYKSIAKKGNLTCILGTSEEIMVDTINELVRAVNKLNNTTYKAENCMTD